MSNFKVIVKPMCHYLLKFSLCQKLATALVCVGIIGFCSQIIAGTTSNVSVTEGNSVTVTYNLGYTAPAGGVDVEVLTNPTTASASDYSIAANQLGWRTISSGSDSIDVSVSATSDSLVEGNEILMVGFVENWQQTRALTSVKVQINGLEKIQHQRVM